MAEDYTKPIMFRPTAEDSQVLELLADKNPVMKASTVDLIRIALQDYMFNHGPEHSRGKTARLDRMERELAEHSALLRAICDKLNIVVEVTA